MELQKFEGEEKLSKQQEIFRIVKAWKLLNNIPTEGPLSKGWDAVHLDRHSKYAKELLLLFIDWEIVVDCMEYMVNHYKKHNLDFNIATVVRNSDKFREQIKRR